MKLLAVFPGFGIGGAQVRFCALLNRFGPAAGTQIVSLNGDLGCQAKLRRGLAVEFPTVQHERGNMVGAVRAAMRYLRAARPDLVVTSNFGAIEWAMAARLLGLRHVHTEDGFGPEEALAQLPRRVWLRRLVLRSSDVVLPSRNLLRIANEIWKLPVARLHYIPNGIDVEKLARGVSAVPPGDGPVIGTLATLRPEKNISRLIQAFGLIRAKMPARLVIVGEGPERPGLRQVALSLGVAADVIFAGYSAQAENFLAGMDVFALSSDTEQMPLSVLEAMAAGLPIVATDVGDVRAMLPAENQAFVVPKSAEALAAAIQTILADPAQAARLGAANQAMARHLYTAEKMFENYAALFGLSLGPAP